MVSETITQADREAVQAIQDRWFNRDEMLSIIAAHRRAAVAELVELLGRYGKHDGLCARVGGYGYCNCGLEEALSRHQAGLGKGGDRGPDEEPGRP